MNNYCLTDPLAFSMRIDYINALTNECLSTQYVPNNCLHSYAVVTVNPDDKKVSVTIDGARVSETELKKYLPTAEKAIQHGSKAKEISHAFGEHFSIDSHTRQGLFRKDSINVLTVSQKIKRDGKTFVEPLHRYETYQSSVSNRVKPTVIKDSVIKASKPASKMAYRSTQVVGVLQKGAGAAGKVLKTFDYVEKGIKIKEITEAVQEGDYKKASRRSGGFAGGELGQKGGVMLATMAGAALVTAEIVAAPIAVPVTLLLIAICAYSGDTVGEKVGEVIGDSLYDRGNSLYNKVVKTPKVNEPLTKALKKQSGANVTNSQTAIKPKPDDIVGTIGIRFNDGSYSEGAVLRSDYRGDDYRPTP